YEAKLAELGQEVTDKAFKDSLYYSMAIEARADSTLRVRRLSRELAEGGRYYYLDTIYEHVKGQAITVGIDPAKIKTIWTSRFNNTNLATKEFEERLAYIFRTCDHALLDVYVNNLDKDLYWCDSVATRMHSEPMSMFLRPAYGRVELPPHAADRLRTFYENNSRAEAEAIRKTQEKFWNEQWKQDMKSDAKRADHATAESLREGALFQKELAANLDTVYKQLGYTRLALPTAAWVVPVTNTGWWNVDKAVIQATANRSSMNYTDDKSGKTATLTYMPLIVDVADRASFDELVVYLIPNQLNSYQRMKEGSGAFTERLNSIFTYDLICLGMKGKEQFAFKTSVSGEAEIKAVLSPVDEATLRSMIGSRSALQQELIDQAEHLEWLVGDKNRRKSNADRQALKAALLPTVFPCAPGETYWPASGPSRSSSIRVADAPSVVAIGGISGVAPLTTLDQAPEFPGGTLALQRYLTTSIRYPDDLIDRGVGGKVYVRFVLDDNGDVERAEVISGVHPKLDAEALRVVSTMPRWKAASDKGRFIRTQLTIPIEFRMQ
ncbi:MAG: energy transducer TonB, partial [Flavobacteriales bacterium]|nr:energy transducer TonB [Flavobacteriales bacterium]